MSTKVRFVRLFLFLIHWLGVLGGVSPLWAGIPHNRVPVQIQLRNGHFKTVRLNKVSYPTQFKVHHSPKGLRAHFMMAAMRDSGPVLPPKVDLGMNQVPVLDQGPWGTCATFATTAAIDAFYPLKKDARISELCNLALGESLDPSARNEGGWNGSSGRRVLGQISQYGYLPVSYQTSKGCGGLKVYPVNSTESHGTTLSVAEFKRQSIKTFTEQHWQPLPVFDEQDDFAALTAVKNNIAAGYRVIIGVVVDPNADRLGVIGRYHGVTATFVLSPQIISDILADKDLAGHEMVITGYDDNACAEYQDVASAKTRRECGLLTLRNSWGSLAGDAGNYYMSYYYFMSLVLESHVIGHS